jgi:hypothetical protein
MNDRISYQMFKWQLLNVKNIFAQRSHSLKPMIGWHWKIFHSMCWGAVDQQCHNHNCLEMCRLYSRNRIPLANGLADARHVRFSKVVNFSDNTRGCLQPFENGRCRDRWAPSVSLAEGQENILQSRSLTEDTLPRDNPNADVSPKAPTRKLSNDDPTIFFDAIPLL